MVLPLKEVAGTLLRKNEASLSNGAKTTPEGTTNKRSQSGIIIGKNKPNEPPINEHYLASHNTIYNSNQKKFDKGQYSSINYRSNIGAPGKKDSFFAIGDILKTSLRNEKAAKKEAAELREKNISDFKEEIEIRYDFALENDLISRFGELSKRGPEIAPKAEKISGYYYDFVMLFVLTKDIIDVYIGGFEFFGIVLVVTAGLSLFLRFISILASIFSYLMSKLFYKVNGISFNIKQWLFFRILPYGIELLPIVGVFPLGTLAFIYSIKAENKFRKQKAKEFQELLDEKHQIELGYIQERLLSSKSTVTRKVVGKNYIVGNKEKPKDNPNKNDWKNMVDETNQNITKQNPQTTPNFKNI